MSLAWEPPLRFLRLHYTRCSAVNIRHQLCPMLLRWGGWSTPPRLCQIPWVGANQCNCSSGPGVSATIPDPDSPMVRLFQTWA